MPITSDNMAERVHCCGCGGRIGRVNLIEMDYRAVWQFPTSGNVLTGDSGRAVAIVCDRCAEAKRMRVVEVVEFNGDLVVYHPLAELVRLPPPRSYVIVNDNGVAAMRCLLCGATTWDPADIQRRRCGYCGHFHEREPAADVAKA